MRVFKNKKIVTLLIALVVSFSVFTALPKTSSAVTRWGYALSSRDYVTICPQTGPMSCGADFTQATCNTARTNLIKDLFENQQIYTEQTITACFSTTINPPIPNDGTMTEATQTISDAYAALGIDRYWYEYETQNAGTTSYYLSTSFASMDLCQADARDTNGFVLPQTLGETSPQSKVLTKPCFMQRTRPDQTPDGTSIQLFAATPQGVGTSTNYVPLALITNEEVGPDGTVHTAPDCTTTNGIETCTGNSGFSTYFNFLIKVFLGICAVLSMIMIVVGGLEYMTGEAISEKADGKHKIVNAIFGLILAVGAYALLNTLDPALLNIGMKNVQKANVTISRLDTSSGSDPSLCISATNPPSPSTATGATLTLNSTMTTNYIPARDALALPTGIKLLVTAQAAIEGFSATPTPGTKSYRTKNPGNIGNTDSGGTVQYATLGEGITAQKNIITNVASGNSPSYKIGSQPTCALGSESYQGKLYQYLRIYSTGARMSNSYLNQIIGYFAANGQTITPETTMAQITAIN